jgi:hypothetical protein
MATAKLKNMNKRQFGNVPYGNVTALAFAMATATNGSVINSDQATALLAADVVDLGPLPEGMRLDDASLFITVGMTATITGSLGFKYEDGVDSAEVPQDAAYFGAGINLATAGRVRATGSKLVTLPKPARLILTTAVAANAKVSTIGVVVTGELLGDR